MIQKEDGLICTICTDVVIQPVQCVECEHLNCRICIEDSLKHDVKCPDCRKVFESTKHLGRHERNYLNKTEFKCFRCPDSFNYEQAEKHAK